MANGQTEIIRWEEPVKFKECSWASGLYPGVVKEIHDTTGKHGDMKRLIFECFNEQAKEIMSLPYTVGVKVTRETKAGKLLLALGVKENEGVSWESLLKRQALVFIEPETWEEEGKKVTRKCITKVLPPIKV